MFLDVILLSEFFSFESSTGICRGSEDIKLPVFQPGYEVAGQEKKDFFHSACFMGKKCRSPDSTPCSRRVVV